MRYTIHTAMPSVKLTGLFAHTATVLQPQFVVLWYSRYWKTSRVKDSRPVQVGQEVSDMNPSDSAMHYVICSAKLSLNDMHGVF